jgi:uncharacterized membrane protein YheB (UPF0754 family)
MSTSMIFRNLLAILLLIWTLIHQQVHAYSVNSMRVLQARAKTLQDFGRKRTLFGQMTQTQSARWQTKIMARSAPDTGIGTNAAFLLRQFILVPLCLICSISAKVCVRRWVVVGAGKKLLARPRLYATIPLIAGLVNFITNKISVWMIFNPINFVGKEFIPRLEGSPAGFFGWQGIVPARVKSMSPDIARTLINLLNLRVIFSRLDSSRLATALEEGTRPILDKFIRKALADQDTNPLMTSLSPESDLYSSSLYARTLSNRLHGAVERIVRSVCMEPEKYLDLESSLVSALVEDKSIICNLFQEVGRDELKFIVEFGLFGGIALGCLQATLWLLWDPAWSLALGGAIVGYLTNLIALAVMFKPIFPVKLPFLALKLQGLFLKRQGEVSAIFAKLSTSQLLQPKQMWEYLCLGPKRRALTSLIEKELRGELEWVFPGFPRQTWSTLASKVQSQLPRAAEPIYSYMIEAMQLERDIGAAMTKMPPDQFENVLHPIFEQDEATLIAVGTVLGAAAGAVQAIFY